MRSNGCVGKFARVELRKILEIKIQNFERGASFRRRDY